MASDMSRRLAGWLRRNRLALVALCVLVPLTPVVIAGPSAREQRSYEPNEPIVVDYGQSTKYGAATIGPASAAFGSDSAGPAGTRVIHVNVAITGAESLLCRPMFLRETSGARRTFTPADRLLGDASQLPSIGCMPPPGDTSIGNSFVVPSDAGGPFVVGLVAVELVPRYVALKVRP